MKLLPKSASHLLLLLLLVELPVLAISRPTPVRHHNDGLVKLVQQMRQLIIIVQGAVHSDTSLSFGPRLTSLPALNFRPKDLDSVQANSTLPQLSSGLQAFKLHFDWLLHWYHQSGLESSKIKEIANLLQSISVLAQRQIESREPNTVLSLPPLTSVWDIHGTSAIIHKRLQAFCNWYLRALQVLKRKSQPKS